MMNDKAENEATDAKLKNLLTRAAQEPISYLPLFRETHELACELFLRAMVAEAELFRKQKSAP